MQTRYYIYSFVAIDLILDQNSVSEKRFNNPSIIGHSIFCQHLVAHKSNQWIHEWPLIERKPCTKFVFVETIVAVLDEDSVYQKSTCLNPWLCATRCSANTSALADLKLVGIQGTAEYYIFRNLRSVYEIKKFSKPSVLCHSIRTLAALIGWKSSGGYLIKKNRHCNYFFETIVVDIKRKSVEPQLNVIQFSTNIRPLADLTGGYAIGGFSREISFSLYCFRNQSFCFKRKCIISEKNFIKPAIIRYSIFDFLPTIENRQT